MTTQTGERTPTAAPSGHGHGSAIGSAEDAYATHTSRRREGGTGGTGGVVLGAIVALPRPVRIIGAGAIGLGGLLIVGVPLATVTPLLLLGGCLSMHLFMGHGMSHGGAHGSPGTTAGPAGDGPVEDPTVGGDR